MRGFYGLPKDMRTATNRRLVASHDSREVNRLVVLAYWRLRKSGADEFTARCAVTTLLWAGSYMEFGYEATTTEAMS